MFKSFHPASQIWLPINRINLRFIPLNFIERIYCFKVVSLQKRSCVVIHNTLKFIESFKVISLFSYQGAVFCCRSRQQLVYYILSSLFCQELFSFFEKFSFNRFCPICYLKRDNFDILSCVVLFVKIFFVLFWKSFQNHVVLCQIMSYPAVSLTIIPLVFYSVNHFLILFSLVSEQQRLNFTLL